MHYQYPLESLARKRGTASQREFANQARRALFDSDEALFEAHDHGLAIFAASEEAIEEPRRVLREIYGDWVEVRRPKVRYMPGEPLQEPIAHARITTRNEFSVAVLAELRRRGARVVEQCTRPRIFIVRAEAPFAALLGLPAKLETMTHGDAVQSIRLVRYAPVAPEPDPIAA